MYCERVAFQVPLATERLQARRAFVVASVGVGVPRVYLETVDVREE